jgi:hypothetical protein
LASLWRARYAGRFDIRRLAWIPIVLLIAAPFVFAGKLRFDRTPPVPFFRSVAAEVPGLTPKGASLVVVDPTGSGESGMIARYEANGWLAADRFISAFTDSTAKGIADAVAGHPAPFALVFSVTPAVREVLGTDLSADTTYLLRRGDDTGGWIVVHTWPKKAAR